MIWGVVGVTGWGLPQIHALPVPLLWEALTHQGTMLRPLVSALLAVKRVEGLRDEPGEDGEPSSVQKVLDGLQRQKQILPPLEPTPKERRFSQAVGVILQPYYGESKADTHAPFPGMAPDEARALVAWVRDGHCPPDVWARLYTQGDTWERIVAAQTA